MSKYLYILDPAHGSDTPGKRSPDGKHREYLWSRNIIKLILDDPRSSQYDMISPFLKRETEPGLSTRVRYYNLLKSIKPKLVISLHNNAQGSGAQWMNARGFSIYTSKGQTKSDKFAEIFINKFVQRFPLLKTRVETIDGDKDYEQNFTILMGSNYFAILMEILFQDNKEDVEILNDPGFLQSFVNYFYDGLEEIERTL